MRGSCQRPSFQSIRNMCGVNFWPKPKSPVGMAGGLVFLVTVMLIPSSSSWGARGRVRSGPKKGVVRPGIGG